MLDTPVLFLIFNRPNTTMRVFERIREARPRQLFVAADGARIHVENDAFLCEQTRLIVEKIDWDCEVKTLFRTENLGCKRAVSEAITWFFEHVEEGIILEDDCLPDETFFFFCQLMLDKYRNNEQILQISGNNFLFDTFKKHNNTYFYSPFNDIWGWATWRRAWSKFSLNMDDWRAIEPQLSLRISNPDFCNWLLDLFKTTEGGGVNSWAIPWTYHFQLNNGICIIPNGNLVQNIGYSGTHHLGGFRHPFLNIPIIPFNIKNIEYMDALVFDNQKDNIMFGNLLKPKWTFWDRLYNKMLRIYLNIIHHGV